MATATLLADVNADTPGPLDKKSRVATLPDRDGTPAAVRWIGMRIYVTAEALEYQLLGGIENSDWVIVTAQTEAEVNAQIDAIRTSDELLTFPSGDTFTGGGGFEDLATGNNLSYDSDATVAEATASDADPNTIFETDATDEVVTVLPTTYGGTGLNTLSTTVVSLLGAADQDGLQEVVGVIPVTKSAIDTAIGTTSADQFQYYSGNGAFTGIRVQSPNGTAWLLCVTDTGEPNFKQIDIDPQAFLDVSGEPLLDVNGQALTAILITI